ncbi:uncharacterized protein I206_104119 [Kwoniella pini CBS 10737]|uniref:Uncharacterized protein n=1 Tax=Kwoniella pini CBS 10737 TaxID=1296096 RepID=A0A1B9I2M3_9TREE|nr:uncharacterized protein I206_04305 [Kwoniella pini CBS 10737]OCF49779.1 hypothetical protein I206_04305 [Kwoniella pini CBS 10737]
MSLPSKSPLPKAFGLIHQILQSSPVEGLSTKEIIKEGLKIYQIENPSYNQQSSSSSSSTSSSTLTTLIGENSIKGKGKNVLINNNKNQKGINIIPEGHPFISTSYLKSRVLATLQSQSLLIKTSQQKQHQQSSSSTSTNTGGGGGKPIFLWKLNEIKQSNLNNIPKWDFNEHWKKLINNEQSPGKLFFNLNKNKELRKKEEFERSLNNFQNKIKRNNQQILQWKDRKPFLTTILERSHLNKRRLEKRPKKERIRLNLFESVNNNGHQNIIQDTLNA